MDTETPFTSSLERSASDTAMTDATPAETPSSFGLNNPQTDANAAATRSSFGLNNPQNDANAAAIPSRLGLNNPQNDANAAAIPSRLGSNTQTDITAAGIPSRFGFNNPQTDATAAAIPSRLGLNNSQNDITAAGIPSRFGFNNPQTPSRVRNRPKADAFFEPAAEKATDPRLRHPEAPSQSALGPRIKDEPNSDNEMELDSYPIQRQPDTPTKKAPRKLTIDKYASDARKRVEESLARKAMQSGSLFSQGNGASLGPSSRGVEIPMSVGTFDSVSQGAGYPAGNGSDLSQGVIPPPHFNEERFRVLNETTPPPETPAEPIAPRTGTKTNATPLLFNRLEKNRRHTISEYVNHRPTNVSPLSKFSTGVAKDDPQTPTSRRSSHRDSDRHGREPAGPTHSDRHHRASGRSSRHRDFGTAHHRDHGRERRRSRSRSRLHALNEITPFANTGGSSKSQRSGQWGSNEESRKPYPWIDHAVDSLLQQYRTPSKSNGPIGPARNQEPIDGMSQGFGAMALNTQAAGRPQFQTGVQSPYEFGMQLMNLGYPAVASPQFAQFIFQLPHEHEPGPQVPELFDIASDLKPFVNISRALLSEEQQTDKELHAMNARLVWQGERQLQLLAMELVIKKTGHLSHQYLLIVSIPHALFDPATHSF
jgi:hypothetical protein